MSEKLILEGRKTLSMNEVKEVKAYNEREIKLAMLEGFAVIRGDNLKIINFSKEAGNFNAEGNIEEIKYSKKKEMLLKRVFK